MHNSANSLALIPALAHFVVKVHLDLQDELQLLVGAERGQRAVDLLAGVHGLPVVLVPQVHLVAAGRLLVVVPAAGAFLCTAGSGVAASVLCLGTVCTRACVSDTYC